MKQIIIFIAVFIAVIVVAFTAVLTTNSTPSLAALSVDEMMAVQGGQDNYSCQSVFWTGGCPRDGCWGMYYNDCRPDLNHFCYRDDFGFQQICEGPYPECYDTVGFEDCHTYPK